MINIHTHAKPVEPNSLSIVNIGGNIENIDVGDKIKFSLGIHPWDITSVDINFCFQKITSYAANNLIIAIGECGLDKIKVGDIELQKEIFVKQIEIANRFKKPMIIHNVRSTDIFLAMMKKKSNETAWIFHGFNGSNEEAAQLINHGAYLSFGAKLMYSKTNQEVFSKVDSGKIFLETDDSNIRIREIYDQASLLKNLETSKMIQIIKDNYKSIFE